MPVDDLDAIDRALTKRGFKQSDSLLHQCADCSAQQVARWGITGRSGGRDISLCLACGKARSWRSGAGMEQREEEVGFDLRVFLKMT